MLIVIRYIAHELRILIGVRYVIDPLMSYFKYLLNDV